MINGGLILFAGYAHAFHFDQAFDRYDQVVYLISQGRPISSFLGFHHLGNHAAGSLRCCCYRYPDVHWFAGCKAAAFFYPLYLRGILPVTLGTTAAANNGSGVLAAPTGI